MTTLKELDFEQRMNELKMKSYERMAVETDPRTPEFESIIDGIKALENQQMELSVQRRNHVAATLDCPGIRTENNI